MFSEEYSFQSNQSANQSEVEQVGRDITSSYVVFACCALFEWETQMFHLNMSLDLDMMS